MKIVQRAHAKINWALDVLARREDGYHDLDMLITSISLFDELSFEPAQELTLVANGRPVPRDSRNLVIKAAEALNHHTGKRRGASIQLVKRIPVRAGLGGGSADCAATLQALNRLWCLGLSMRELIEIGATLGSDVPVCMGIGLARVRGVGEKLLRMEAKRRVPLVILHPGMGLGTPDVFRKWDETERGGLGLNLDGAQKALMDGDMEAFFGLTGNALERSAIALMPEVWDAREALLGAGARFAQMSGSGSAVYGVFDDWSAARQAKAQLGPKAILTQTYP